MYIIESLYKKAIFRLEFEKIKKKYQNPRDREKFLVTPEITLNWALNNEDFIIKKLIKTIKTKKYEIPLAKETLVHIGDKDRLLYQFDWHEKILQGAIATLLTERLEQVYPEVLNSYRKGRSTYQTLIKIKKFVKTKPYKNYVYRNDVESYGDSINHSILLKILKKHIKEPYLLDILKKIIKFKYIDLETGKIKTKKIGLPTGSPINNIMTNLYLMDLDKRIERVLLEKAHYYRYGDDVIIISKTLKKYNEIKKMIENAVSNQKLNLNKEKIIETVFDIKSKNTKKIKYLGFKIDKWGNFSLTENKRNKIKKQITDVLRRATRLSYKELKNDEEKVQFLINTFNNFVFETNFLVDLAPYLKLIENKETWKFWDIWIAKTILHLVFSKKSKKALFQKYSFKKLRENNLLSILYIKELYLYDKSRFNLYKEKLLTNKQEQIVNNKQQATNNGKNI